MKIFSISAKWFLSLAFAALLVTGTFTGCENKDNTAGPASIIQNPTLGNVMAIQNRHTTDLMSIDGVEGTGTGLNQDGAPAIYVFTTRDNVAGIPSSIEGVRTHIENIGTVVAFGKPSSGYTGTYRGPLYSGVSVGNDNECASGTISCVVTDGTKNYLLSNNHVFARENAAATGERIDQPGRYDAVPQCSQTGQVASLSNFIPISFTSNNTVDCAIAEISAGINATTTSVANYTPTATTETASVGLAVKKTGRTTGLTSGKISAINVTSKVSYGTNKTATFTGQIYISGHGFSDAGDSGSLIVDSNNNDPVGLLFAGSSTSTIANPIGAVLTALGVTIVEPAP
jgi:hypothetical protein